MKLKLLAIITDPDAFLRGDYHGNITLYELDPRVPGWISTGEIEIELDINRGELIDATLGAIDKQMEKETREHQQRMFILELRKAELLSLPAPSPQEPTKSVD